MNNHPKYYNLFLTRCTCTGCGEEYIYPTVWLAREIPKGEAFSRVPENGTVWDLPINKKEVHDTVPFCMMCVDKIEKEQFVKDADIRRIVNLAIAEGPEPEFREGGKVIVRKIGKPAIALDLKALGLIP